MKATLDIPDELYRRVKARSAMEGRPIRAVALQLFENWLNGTPPQGRPPEIETPDLTTAPWLAISRRYVRPGMSHDLDEINAAIEAGSATETAEKLKALKS